MKLYLLQVVIALLSIALEVALDYGILYIRSSKAAETLADHKKNERFFYLQASDAKYPEVFSEKMNMSFNAAFIEIRSQQCQWTRSCFMGLCKYSTKWMTEQEREEYDRKHINPYDQTLSGSYLISSFTAGNYTIDQSLIIGGFITERSLLSLPVTATSQHISNFSRTPMGSGFRYMGGGTFFRPYKNRPVHGIELGALSAKKSQALLSRCVPGDARIDIYGFKPSAVSVIGKVNDGRNISIDAQTGKGFVTGGMVPASELIFNRLRSEIDVIKNVSRSAGTISVILLVSTLSKSFLEIAVVIVVHCLLFNKRVGRMLPL